jgi:hypothetical protein
MIKVSFGRSLMRVWMIEDKGTLKLHPPAHHPLDARYYSVVDETQPS